MNFWQDPMSPSKWKEEHVSLSDLCDVFSTCLNYFGCWLWHYQLASLEISAICYETLNARCQIENIASTSNFHRYMVDNKFKWGLECHFWIGIPEEHREYSQFTCDCGKWFSLYYLFHNEVWLLSFRPLQNLLHIICSYGPCICLFNI